MDVKKLHDIDEQLKKEDVAALKFLCLDFISKKRLETVKDAKDLFMRLKEENLLEDEHLLSELLFTIRRNDLLHILGTNKMKVRQMLQVQEDSRKPGVSAYRKFLYEISEDITEDNLRDFKFLLTDLPKDKKRDSVTFLELLVEMEKMDSLGVEKLDELENILDKCAKDLTHKVQEYKNKSVTTVKPVHMPRPVDPPNQQFPTPRVTMHQNQPLSLPESDNQGSLNRQRENLNKNANGFTSLNEDEYYPVNRRPLGYCLIINNYIYREESQLNRRAGSEMDEDALTKVFQRMHFQVEVRSDLLGDEILKTVREFSAKDHSQMDVFVCCILSHGEKDAVIGVDGKPASIQKITQAFSHCMTLTGKPKLFFIQACQGDKMQQGVWMHDGPEMQDEFEEDARGISVPYEADILMGMSTVPNYKSFRSTKTGSIFIQELCRQLEIGCPKKEDILSILIKVNANVSKEEFLYNKFKQMPEPRYTLTRKLMLPMDCEA